MPLGYRSCRVLTVIAAQPGASNREVADAAEVSDQGQSQSSLRAYRIAGNGGALPRLVNLLHGGSLSRLNSA